MARTLASLPAGSRVTDYISLGVVSRAVPREKIDSILAETGKTSIRQRELPAHLVVYYVIALALYMQSSYREVLRCLLEGVQWLTKPGEIVRATGKSGISQARSRLGAEPLRRLYEQVVVPIASKNTRGSRYRTWRLISLDGSTLDVADTEENENEFGRPPASRGASAYPQLRFVALLENGTHVLLSGRMGSYRTSEITLAKEVVPQLKPGMLCLADRFFFGFTLWTKAQATGCELLWRVRKHLRLEVLERRSDGSYLSAIYPSEKDARHKTKGVRIRVIDYQLEGIPDAEPIYRLVTTILDPLQAPAQELAALYHERWEIENTFDELKTHLRGRQIVLRSKTPELVRQEFYGFLLAHFAVRELMHEAALSVAEDPDRLSFLHAVRVVRRKLSVWDAIPPSGEKKPPPRHSG
jgi:Insertion element 4 transposase N-terminal/Transposase DDE domain